MTARRTRRQQARPLPGERSLLWRLVGPTILAGALLGVLLRLVMVSALAPAAATDELELAIAVEQADSLAVAEVPAAPIGPPEDPRVLAERRMGEAVLTPLRGLPGRFGIAVKDLGSGVTVLVNEATPFQAASLYKLPVMYEMFKLREARALTFREELTIDPATAAFDLGTLNWPIGTRVTLGTALEWMVTISDNASGVMLARTAGAARINDDALRLGMRQTFIRGDELSTSAVDMLRFLELIASGQLIDGPTSAEMVHLLARQQVRNRIPALLPPEAIVANKTGDWEGAIHDVGIVYAPRATLVIVLLSDGAGDPEAVYGAMARAARNLYDLVDDPAFDARPGPPLPPMEYASYATTPRPPVMTAEPVAADRVQRSPAQLIGADAVAAGLAGAPTAATLEATSRATPGTPGPTPEPTPKSRATVSATATVTAAPPATRTATPAGQSAEAVGTPTPPTPTPGRRR